MYIIVSPFKNSFDEKGLIYLVPNSLIKTIKIGQIVKIPLKNNVDIAVVLDIINKPLEIELSKIKSIINIHNEKEFLNSYQVNIIFWLSKYYFTFIHNSLNLFFPKNLKDKILNKKINFENNKKLTYNYLNDKLLTKAQSKAFNQIINSNEKILFYGITGSGKTQIYIELINIYLQKNKQSLLLIPEIILNKQISNRLNIIFGNNIIILNSSITNATKTKNRIDIYNNNAKIIIGTRSALFYPYNNLGIIIIDEQHDNSYFSDNQPRYSSIEVAEKITNLYGNKLVMASGTPSIISMYKALSGNYKLVNLLEKFK